MLAKQLSFLANADSAGLVLGARVPVILTSRADSLRSRIASCARRGAGRPRPAATPRALSGREAPWTTTRSSCNAGSSSLKFCVYRRPSDEALAARGARPDRRHRHVAALHGQGRRRRVAGRRDARRVGAATAARRSTSWPRGCAPATAARACSASATASCTAAPGTPARASSRRRCSRICGR